MQEAANCKKEFPEPLNLHIESENSATNTYSTPAPNPASQHPLDIQAQEHDLATKDEAALEQSTELSKLDSTPVWSIFSPWEKKWIVMIASLGAFFSPLTTNIYFPALNDIAKDLDVSINMVNLSITTYMIFQALVPSFLGTFSDETGRRPVYIIGFSIYMAANIGLALNNSYVGLMILRCVQSGGSSSLATLKIAIICDVVTSAERGSYIAFTSAGTILGPSIGPIAGGLLAQHLGWHSIFWFLVICSAIFFVPLLFFFPETCRRIVGDGSIPPAKWNRSFVNVIHDRREKKAGSTSETAKPAPLQLEIRSRRYPNPMGSLRLMAEKETAVILLFVGILYAGFYGVTTTITTQFHDLYGLSSTDTGLLFLPQAVGGICAAFTNGRLLDYNYRRHAKRLGFPVDKKKQHSLIGFPIERARLEIGIPLICITALAGIAYGWLLQFRVSIAPLIVMLFIMGYTALAGFSTLSVLIEDIHRTRAATAAAANNFVRCLLGAGSSAVINPMIEAMGQGWCFTFIGLVFLASVPMLLVVIQYGPEWRRVKFERAQQREREREAQKPHLEQD